MTLNSTKAKGFSGLSISVTPPELISVHFCSPKLPIDKTSQLVKGKGRHLKEAETTVFGKRTETGAGPRTPTSGATSTLCSLGVNFR